jgi:hypothetical protein
MTLPLRFAAALLIGGSSIPSVAVEGARDAGKMLFNGNCGILYVASVEIAQPGPCGQAVELYVPSAVERQNGMLPTLRLNVPKPGVPTAVFELGQATQNEEDRNHDTIRFKIVSVRGVAGNLPADAFGCYFMKSPADGNVARFPNAKPYAELQCSGGGTASIHEKQVPVFSFRFFPDPAEVQSLRDAFVSAYNILNPNRLFVSPSSLDSRAVADTVSEERRLATQGTAATLAPIFGLTLGAPFPNDLPSCSSRDMRGIWGVLGGTNQKSQFPVCIGVTEGGVNQQGIRRWRDYRLIPIMPSDARLAAEFPELADLLLGSHSIFAFVDSANVLQGFNISSLTFDGDRTDKVVTMLDRRYGPGWEVKHKRFVFSADSRGREEFLVDYLVWRKTNVYVRFGPPESQPASAYRDIVILTPKGEQALLR